MQRTKASRTARAGGDPAGRVGGGGASGGRPRGGPGGGGRAGAAAVAGVAVAVVLAAAAGCSGSGGGRTDDAGRSHSGPPVGASAAPTTTAGTPSPTASRTTAVPTRTTATPVATPVVTRTTAVPTRTTATPVATPVVTRTTARPPATHRPSGHGPCYEGRCRITVTQPASIAVDSGRFGFTHFTVTHVSDSDVTIAATTVDGTQLQSGGSPGGTLGLNNLTVRVLSVHGRSAVLELSPS